MWKVKGQAFLVNPRDGDPFTFRHAPMSLKGWRVSGGSLWRMPLFVTLSAAATLASSHIFWKQGCCGNATVPRTYIRRHVATFFASLLRSINSTTMLRWSISAAATWDAYTTLERSVAIASVPCPY